MDHLPCPIDGTRPHVPFYACRQIYQPDDFFKLPRAYGYDDFPRLLEDGLYQPMVGDSPNEFLQSWLFFALLSQVLGVEIDTADFLIATDVTLHTKRLTLMLEQWAKREGHRAEKGLFMEQKNRHVRASMALGDARRFVSKHCSYRRLDRDPCSSPSNDTEVLELGNPAHDALNKEMTLSLAILGETLQQAWPDTLSLMGSGTAFWRDPGTEETNWGQSKYCRDKMKEKGYCPLEIRRIESILPSVSIVYYASFMETFKRRSDTSKCTIWQCNCKKEAQEALHMNNCQGSCPTYQIGEDKLIKIIEEGKTPLVTWTYRGELECKGYDLKKEGLKFGALSHSWEDSIVDCGRDARNKNNRHMHQCQIESLRETFNRLLDDRESRTTLDNFPFWVDTLCFPRQYTVKGKALNQLKDIYHKAAAVLVWDRNLLQRPKTAEQDTIEMNMRIRTSDWSWRLWTFQEAILAPKHSLHVAFRGNDTVSIDELQRARDKSRQDPYNIYHHIWKAGHPFSPPIWKLRNEKEFRVQRAWEGVQFRLVSQPEDETIVLASALGLDVTKIQSVGKINENPEVVAAKRMVKFLDLLDATPGLGIPSGIIFLPPPKLRIKGIDETKGYGWAPATWLTKQSKTYPLFRPLKQTASIMKRGLLVEFPGLILHCPNTPIQENKFWVSVHQCMHKWFKVVADIQDKEWNRFWESNISPYSELSIIMSTQFPRERWEVGILAKTKGKLSHGEVRWVESLCRVWFCLETNSNIVTDLLKSIRESGDKMLCGERLEETQKWCIDGGED